MELDCGGGVPARGFTDSGPEVEENLEGNKAIRSITLARVEVVRKMGPHGIPRRRR
jgi:hypothetical protein